MTAGQEWRFRLRVGDDAPDVMRLQVVLRAGDDGLLAAGEAVIQRPFPASEARVTPEAGGALRFVLGTKAYAAEYDANGNMTSRVVAGQAQLLEWGAENRLIKVTQGASVSTFVYDGDGNRVKATVGGVSTVYIGGYYEQSGSAVRTYYYHGGQRVAMREAGVTTWLFGDHLGSTSVAYRESDAQTTVQRYYAWGTIRPGPENVLPTDYTFTGQRLAAQIDLYEMGARWYDGRLGRWLSPDTIVPVPGNPQDLNRLTYAGNNPVRYTDPTGHYIHEESPDDPFFVAPQDDLPAMRSRSIVGPKNTELDLMEKMAENARAEFVSELRDLNYAAVAPTTEPSMRAVYRERAWSQWYDIVAQGNALDYKKDILSQYGETIRVGSRWFDFDIFANINYGYVGKAAGFTDFELKAGAGAAQFKNNVLDFVLEGKPPRLGNLGGPSSYFDDPRDQAAIQIGIDLYDQYGLDITPERFYRVFYRYAYRLVK